MLSASSSLDGCTPAAAERVEVRPLLGGHLQRRSAAPARPAGGCARSPAPGPRTRSSDVRHAHAWRSRRRRHAAAADQHARGTATSGTSLRPCSTGPATRRMHDSKVPADSQRPRRDVCRARRELLDGGDEVAGHRGRAAGPRCPSRAGRRSGSRSARCGRRRRGSAGRTCGCCPGPDRSTPIIAAGSLHVSRRRAEDPQPGVVVGQQLRRARRGRATSSGRAAAAPHMAWVLTPPNCARPAVIAPFVTRVCDGVRKPDSEPA